MNHNLEKEKLQDYSTELETYPTRSHISVEPIGETKVKCLIPIDSDMIRDCLWLIGKQEKSLKRLQGICDNLLDTLKAAGKLTTFGTRVKIGVEENYFCVELRGDTRAKKELFSYSLMELLAPTENREWILEPTNQKVHFGRNTYLGVTEIFSGTKEDAECFRDLMGIVCEEYRVVPYSRIRQVARQKK